jgi:hypothetical protein
MDQSRARRAACHIALVRSCPSSAQAYSLRGRRDRLGSLAHEGAVTGLRKCRLWVTGCLADWVSGTTGVPEIPDDLSHGTRSSASGQQQKSGEAQFAAVLALDP